MSANARRMALEEAYMESAGMHGEPYFVGIGADKRMFVTDDYPNDPRATRWVAEVRALPDRDGIVRTDLPERSVFDDWGIDEPSGSS